MVCYWHVPGECIYLICAYVKSAQSDLTHKQIKTLAQLILVGGAGLLIGLPGREAPARRNPK